MDAAIRHVSWQQAVEVESHALYLFAFNFLGVEVHLGVTTSSNEKQKV
jgi:hypothetical protein